jgi:hypothetical protein
MAKGKAKNSRAEWISFTLVLALWSFVLLEVQYPKTVAEIRGVS